jgi:hypothetical protein
MKTMKGATVKKIMLLAVVALVTAIVPSLAGAVGSGDVKGPACADVIFGDPFYGSPTDAADRNANARINLAAPSCTFITYTLVVLDEATGSELARIEQTGDGESSLLLLSGPSGDADDDTICVYVETSVGGGKHVFDRGPDNGCRELLRGGGSPGLSDFS